MSGSSAWTGMEVLVLAPTPSHPRDAGNRLRISEVCLGLQRRGARITYVHYPGEQDWRHDLPRQGWDAMRAAWDDCHVVPVTVPLHRGALGADHTIDEWWDPAIGDMLRWLFRVRRFDAMIVNYAWLSKAFEFCPRDVLKILDTHDRFSGRRELLAAHGIAAEFFHTTEEQEKIALDRADLVWSIKSDEADFFRSLTQRPVLNLPHAGPIEPLPLRMPTEFMRFGIVGAANTINLINIRHFLATFHQEVRRSLLPCEIVIAGSICSLLADDTLPGYISLAGRMPDLNVFYASVDAVLTPIAFSTGLKIKVAEALSLAKPLVSHAHAFEGFPPQHDFHRCADFASMASAMTQLVATPDLLGELATASVAAAWAVRSEFETTLNATIIELRERRRAMVIMADAASLVAGTIAVDHAMEAGSFVGQLAPLTFLIDGDGTTAPDADVLDRLADYGSLVLTPRAGALPRDPGRRPPHVIDLSRLASAPLVAVWLAGPVRSLPDERLRFTCPAYVSFESFAHAAPPAAFPGFIDALRASFPEIIVLARNASTAVAGAVALPGVRWHRVPPLYRGNHSPSVQGLRAARPHHIAVLADAADDPLAALVAGVCLKAADRPVEVVSPTSDILGGALPPAVTLRTPSGYVRACMSGEQPALVIDAAAGCALDGLRAVLDRIEVPSVTLFARTARPARGVWADRHESSGLFESVATLTDVLRRLRHGEPLAALRRQPGYADDGGWTLLWSDVGRLAAASGNRADR